MFRDSAGQEEPTEDLMEASELTNLRAEVIYATMDYSAAWHRGIKGVKQAFRPRSALKNAD